MDEDAKSSTSSNEWENIEESDEKRDNSTWMDLFGNGDFRRRILFMPSESISETNDVKTLKKNDQKPTNGDLVRIKVMGRIKDQTSSKIVDQHNEIEFVIGWLQVIEAWEMTVQMMCLGEIDEIQVSSRFAYGPVGLDPDIPPDTSITYKIELLHVEPGPNLEEMDNEKKLDIAEDRKLRGNYHFNRQDHTKAIECYEKALDITGINDQFDPTAHFFGNIRVALYNNLAATHLKLERWQEVLDSTERCLKIEPKNAKALYRRARALQCRKDFRPALEIYEQIAALGYEIKELKFEIAKCKEGVRADRDRMKKLYSKMVGGLSDETTLSASILNRKNAKRLGYVALAAAAAVGASVAYRFIK